MSERRFLTVLAAFALATAMSFAAIQPSLAEDDDDDGPTGLQKLFGSIGILSLPGPQIDYQERPPLVVPPITNNYVQPHTAATQPDAWDFSNPRQPAAPAPENNNAPPPAANVTLPPPVEPGLVRHRNPDFPVDPEVKAAQKKKKKTRMFSRAEEDPTYSGRTLRADEMKGTGPLTRGTKGASQTDATANEAQSTVQQLGIPGLTKMLPMIGHEQQEKPLVFTGEPERQSLTEPPSGYLTPSKNAPYGAVAKDKQKDDRRLVHPNMPDYSGPIQTR
ncbi:MAG: hypothetical protein KF807_04350 [Xanthobacteraceae bacterium]|nr:hypothetical protein [Xanthobacteraceae bacterium]